jgi:hypothetical protein
MKQGGKKERGKEKKIFWIKKNMFKQWRMIQIEVGKWWEQVDSNKAGNFKKTV